MVSGYILCNIMTNSSLATPLERLGVVNSSKSLKQLLIYKQMNK